MLKVSFFIFSIIIIFSSCKKGFQYHKGTEGPSFYQIEAKLFDIPLPIKSEFLNSEDNYYLFKFNLDKTNIIEFFKCQMETSGWNLTNSFDSKINSILIYNKPTKTLAINIQEMKNYCLVSLFVNYY